MIDENKTAGLPLLGGALAALAGSACCVGPLALVSVGVGGAWIGGLTAFAPYSPIFVVLAFAAFGFAAYRLFLAPRLCAPGAACADPRVLRKQRTLFMIAAPLAAALVLFPLYAGWFY